MTWAPGFMLRQTGPQSSQWQPKEPLKGHKGWGQEHVLPSGVIQGEGLKRLKGEGASKMDLARKFRFW